MITRPLLLLTVCGLSLPLASCSSTPQTSEPASVRAAGAIAEPQRRLEALAEIETLAPTRVPGSAEALARSIDPAWPGALPPGSAEFRRASRPLEQVLLDSPVGRPVSEIEPPSPADRAAAASAYTRGRAARLDDDAPAAVALLEEAVELDPGSARLWEELGESRLATDDRFGAVDALTMAAELGSTNPRVMLTLASDAAARSDSDEVARWAGAAWNTPDIEQDPVHRVLAGAMLGSALLDRGDLLAGAEALSDAARTLDAHPPTPNDPAELTRLRLRRAELGFRLGDAWAALGQPTRAAEAYAQANRGDGREPLAITQRTIAALVASGRPANAALRLIDHTRAWRGDLGQEEGHWLRGLGADDRVGPPLRAVLTETVRDASIPLTARAQVLRMLVRGASDPGAGADAINDHPEAVAGPGAIADALSRVIPTQRTMMATRSVAAHPSLARAWAGPLVRVLDNPLGEAERMIRSRDSGERALGMALLLELDRADLAGPVVTLAPDSGADPFLAAALAGAGGHWDRVDPWLDAARAAATADPAHRSDLFNALLACQRLPEAAELANAIEADPDATPEELLNAADLALAQGDFETALGRLDRAAAIDPFDERLWERRLGLRTGESPLADEAEAMRLGRELSERRPRSPLFGMLRARELAGQGQLLEACDAIMNVNAREPARDLGLVLLMQGVLAAQQQELGDRVAAVTEWANRRAEALPGSVPLAQARAQLLLGANDNERAYELLDDAFNRIGHPELARNLENVLNQRLARPDESVAHALDRLAGPQGVNASLERAEVGVAAQRWPLVIESARAALPPGGEMAEQQLGRWFIVVFELVRNAEPAGLTEETLALLDHAARAGVPMPEELVRGQMLLLARTGETDRLMAFVAEEPLGPDSGLIAVQALLGADRTREALSLLGDLATDGQGVYEDLLGEWVRLVGSLGTVDDLRAMLAQLDTAGDLSDAARSVREQFAPGDLPGEPTPARDRADIAYIAALIAGFLDREPESEAMHRLALAEDPTHAWAANDLGYGLADRDAQLDEAESLLIMAFETLPEETSVIDSLGWVRYKLGVLEDETDPDGTVTRAGALTLLLRAAQTEDGRENATILEHLGDTQWRLGDREAALASWSAAERALRRQARELAATEQPNTRQADQINERIRAVRRRLSDAESDREPGVATIPGQDRPPPPTDAPGEPISE